MNEKDERLFKTLGKRIRNARKERNITVAQLSQKTGICKSYLYKIENGKAYGVLLERHLFPILGMLKVKCSDIFKGL